MIKPSEEEEKEKEEEKDEEEETTNLGVHSPRTVAQTEEEEAGGGSSTAATVETKLEPLEFSSEISLGVESLPSSSSSSQDLLSSTITPATTFISTMEDTKTKLYLKPPMSPELMIAIAVRNLDPGKVVGASCSDIVAFLCLHFPYFTDNYLECKVTVRYFMINHDSL